MRDAFGGAFMIKLFLVFIFVYICLTAMAVNYAKAFKVKNEVVAYLEDNEVTDICKMNAEEITAMEDFFEKDLVGGLGYSVKEYKPCESNRKIEEDGQCIGYCYSSGIKIIKAGEAINTEGVYYTVSTYMGWGVPFLTKLLQLNGNNEMQETVEGTWIISGQTRVIVRK